MPTDCKTELIIQLQVMSTGLRIVDAPYNEIHRSLAVLLEYQYLDSTSVLVAREPR